MADEQQQDSEMEKPEAAMAESTTDNKQETPQGKATEQEIEEIRAALKKANAEAAKYRKQASAFEEAEQKRKEAEMSEMEKLQKQLADAQAQAAALQRETLQRKVASEMGLPEALALRLQGDDEEAMKEDAKTILESLPKAAKPQVQPTNPANGQPPKETDAMRRTRIYSGGQDNTLNAFDPASAAKMGGGVHWDSSKGD